MKETINTDYIGSVSTANKGRMEYVRVPIPKLFDDELHELAAMRDNENRTLMDLQDYFMSFMPKSKYRKAYDYCSPNQYSAAYIVKAAYPEIRSLDEFKKIIKDAESEVITNFLQECNVEQESELTLYQTNILNAQIEESKKECVRILKQNFYREAERYIKAYRYYTQLKHVKADKRIKMYSTENIGWTTFSYQITDDIHFFMKSNFGYGHSSYLYINLTYKGIDILPYSDYVKYYHVDTIEFYRYTRQYRPLRENWEVAMDFVVSTANLALKDETRFITRYIANEIDEMLAGLQKIASQPKRELKEISTSPHRGVKLLYVHNANREDYEELAAYEDEVSAIFKAEKLSGALHLLEKLQALAPAYPKAADAMEQIRSLNAEFLPDIDNHISDIEYDIKRRKITLDLRLAELKRMKDAAKPHYDKVKELCEATGKPVGLNARQRIMKEYTRKHPNFSALNDRIKQCETQIKEIQKQISQREGFVRRFNACKELIAALMITGSESGSLSQHQL